MAYFIKTVKRQLFVFDVSWVLGADGATVH